MHIIELVHSIYRDGADMQYIIIPISPNLKDSKLVGVHDNIPSIFECFHDQQDSQWCDKA